MEKGKLELGISVISMIKFFLKSVNRCTIVTELTELNSVLDLAGFLALPLNSGQTVFNHLHLRCPPPYSFHTLCELLLNLSINYLLTTNRAFILMIV